MPRGSKRFRGRSPRERTMQRRRSQHDLRPRFIGSVIGIAAVSVNIEIEAWGAAMSRKPNTEIAALAEKMAEKTRAALKEKFGDDEAAARAYLEAAFVKAKRKVEREMEARRRRQRCDGCQQALDRRLRPPHVRLGPIVHDHIWQQIAEPDERLCLECMEKRGWQRFGRTLMLADLWPCEWNLIGQPYSFFDLYLSSESAPPTNLAEWRSVGKPGEFAPLNFERTTQENDPDG
jgi:hypothetical protein